MSLATAGVEIPALAEKHGFKLVSTHGRSVAYFHKERLEGFSLCSNEGAFEHASWNAQTEYITVVDKRKAGEFGREGRALVGDAKRRPVGVDSVRAEMRTSIKGMDIGYLNIKRRIKDPDWRQK